MTLRQARSEHLTMRAIPKMPEIEDKKVGPLDRQGHVLVGMYLSECECKRCSWLVVCSRWCRRTR